MQKTFIAEEINEREIPHAYITGFTADPRWHLYTFRVTIKDDGFEIVPDGMTEYGVKRGVVPQQEIDDIVAVLQTKVAEPDFDGFYADVLISGVKAHIGTPYVFEEDPA